MEDEIVEHSSSTRSKLTCQLNPIGDRALLGIVKEPAVGVVNFAGWRTGVCERKPKNHYVAVSTSLR